MRRSSHAQRWSRRAIVAIAIVAAACQHGSRGSASQASAVDSAFKARWKATARYRERMRAELTAANKVQTVGETLCEGSRVLETLGRANGDRAIDEADSLVDVTRADSDARRALDASLSGSAPGVAISACDSIRRSWPPLDTAHYLEPYFP